jgi:hypothetical protein
MAIVSKLVRYKKDYTLGINRWQAVFPAANKHQRTESQPGLLEIREIREILRNLEKSWKSATPNCKKGFQSKAAEKTSLGPIRKREARVG